MSTALSAEVGRPLAGQVAIVTGAGQGMGLAFARRLCQAGAAVALAEINAVTGEGAAAELAAEGHLARPYRVDVRDAVQIQAMVDDLVARYGRIDILVNNAGVAAGGPSESVPEQEWDLAHGVMLKGMFTCSQIVGRVMIGQRRGRIVNICSMAGIGGWPERAAYTSAKAGAIALTQVLGVEWARHDIRVNGISPGQIETAMNEIVFARGLARRDVYTDRAPMRRFAAPEEIAEAVLFLVSDDATFMNAAVLTIDGGWLAWGGMDQLIGA
ncbi:MAG: SDR family oxidoreductase [Chloroflexota bacterium]|nr:SDR family oxidoreductase [Chloroflexota bacterium]